MKKIIALFFSLMMIVSSTVTAFADTTGTITIKNPEIGKTYNLYKIFDLESYDNTAKTYSYKLNDKWSAFVKTGKGQNYVTLTTSGTTTYVTWKEDADVQEFAKQAYAYAQNSANNITADKTIIASADNVSNNELAITGLDLGYYLVDTPLGTVCSLTTTNPSVEISEKSTQPTVVKQVAVQSASDATTNAINTNYVSDDTAAIGDTVSFKDTITAGKGTENLVLHNKLASGFTFDPTSLTVRVKTSKQSGEVKSSDYTWKLVTSDLTDGDTFEIQFNPTYAENIEEGTEYYIEYNATLNKDAVISGETAATNDSTATLSFGESFTSTASTATVSTYMFDLVKTDSNGVILDGAEFTLYDAQTDGNAISVVEVSADATNGVYVYRVATQDEIDAGTSTTTIKAGRTTVNGLDKVKYYLNENVAPSGYNKLSSRAEVDLLSGSQYFKSAITTNGGKYTGQTVPENNGGVEVINNSGGLLPSTGGMGTTVLYVAGAALILAAGGMAFRRKEHQ